MSIDPALLVFAGVVFLGYAVQTVTGFGSSLLCVTFGALFLPIPEIVALTVPISLLQTGYIAIRHRREVRLRVLARQVLPAMGGGFALGFLVIRGMSGSGLQIAFGLLVFVLAARELWMLRPQRSAPAPRPIHPAAAVGAIFGAGVVHGVYTTGGPLLVYAIGKSGLSKGEIRSTLSVVWLIFAIALGVGFALEGRYGPERLLDVAFLVPAVPLGVLVGEWLHHRVDERRFRTAMFTLILAAAVALLARA